MRDLLWINGSINSGKTTIAKLICNDNINTINIELDTISDFCEKIDIDKKLTYLIQDGLYIANNWINRGYFPILNWPLYGKEMEFMIEFSKQLQIIPIIVTLTPNKEIVKSTRKNRKLDDWELNRIDYMYDICQIQNPKHGITIDNSFLTEDETYQKILNHLNNINVKLK